MISVVILTKNEEEDLPRCLKSLDWCNDILLLDSGSTDRTIEIANQFGIKHWYNPFESFAKQRNYALDFLEVQYDWVLFLDADEVVTDAFQKAIHESIKKAGNETAGFYCCWMMMFEEKWLKRCDNFPKWQFRLLRKGKARFVDSGHGQKEGEVDGEIGYIREPYLHYGFSKGWHRWLERHNKYSSLEAASRLADIPSLKNIFSRHGSKRNSALKPLLSRTSMWPLLRFLYTYVFSLGFLEGKPGLIYCVNMAYYEFLIQIKMRELRYCNIHKDRSDNKSLTNNSQRKTSKTDKMKV